MLSDQAPSPDAPIHLITGRPPAPTEHVLSLGAGLAIIGLIVAIALAAWAVIAYRAALEKNPAEHAFRRLARRLRIPPRHTSLLRRLATEVQCAPVALLISDHALRAAALCFERTGPGKRDQANLKSLLESRPT
jgi:hypothetical protein